MAWQTELPSMADARLDHVPSTTDAPLPARRARDDYVLARAKERSHKALLLVLKIGRVCK